MKKHDRIQINPNIMFGKPVIKDTRITVEQILRKLAGGMTVEEVMATTNEVLIRLKRIRR